jgi:hypothetical protein
MKHIFLTLLIATALFSCKSKPVYVEYFKDGEMLLPDVICPDTLIVVDAIGLNKGMALYEQGFVNMDDYSLDSLMHAHCKIK